MQCKQYNLHSYVNIYRAVINKTVAPLNPLDPKPVQMYIYNNIFFSYAIDTDDRYEEVEGRYTYASANNDLKGVMMYNSIVSPYSSSFSHIYI